MALSPIIASLIKRMGDAWNPGAARAEYAESLPVWRLYMDLLELDASTLGALVEAHPDEVDAKKELRRGLAAVFNFVPSLIRMTANYLHSEQPSYDVADAQIKAFIDNCNGTGLSFPDYVRREALPLALTLGWIDCLVQLPATPDDAFVTAADQQQAGEAILPRVFTITPLTRMNWSAKQSDEYNWLRFKDHENENPMPFMDSPQAAGLSFITVSGAAKDEKGNPLLNEDGSAVGFWVRSYPDTKDDKVWLHDGDWLPTRRCPISTLYYQKSIDPERRHFGLSKIAMIAILTKKLIQLLSWSDEQVLANLAIFVFPGTQPIDDKGQPIAVKLSPFSVIWLGNEAKIDPRILQGDTGHIQIIWTIIAAYIQEILRLAFLIGASAEAEKITSGVQGVVMRTELFQELSDLAGQLDRFALDTLALVASLIYSEDITVETLIDRFKPTVSYYKGNYSIDPLETVIKNSLALIDAFRDISPSMVQAVYRQMAQAALYNEDQSREAVFTEIADNYATIQADRTVLQTAISNAGNVAAANTSLVAAGQETGVVAMPAAGL